MTKYEVRIGTQVHETVMSEDYKSAVLCACMRVGFGCDEVKCTLVKTSGKFNTVVTDTTNYCRKHFNVVFTPRAINV